MSKRQLATLFICIAIPFALGNAQVGLLSIYLTHLQVDSASVGNYLALIFLALAVGTIVAGWLSDRFQRRKEILIGATAVQALLGWLVSQTTQVWQIIGLLIIAWFMGGIAIAMANILAGLFAPENERGKVFGILGVAVNVGTMLGGLLVGFVVQRWGYTTLFTVVAVFNLLLPIAGFFLEDKVVAQDHPHAASTATTVIVLGAPFYILLVAYLLANSSLAFANLGRPLIMDKAGFDSESIASVITVGGAASIPVPFIVGWLSDRLGRFRLIAVSYLAVGASVAFLAVSTTLWHFWFSALLGAGLGAGNAVASALVTDLVPPQGLSKALSWINAVGWAGGVIGFAVTGYVISGLGLTGTFVLGGLLAVLSIPLLVRVRSQQPTPVVV